MITRLFSRSALHQQADPAQRVLGVKDLPPEAEELAQLLADDPAPEVRAAAAQRCADLAALAAAWESETHASVRDALASALGRTLCATPDGARACAVLEAALCGDAIRAEVARRAQDPERRRSAIAAIGDEARLVALALGAEHAETRIAAAERVLTTAGLQKLAHDGKNRDRGVARLARQRLDAMQERRRQQAEADAVVDRLQALAAETAPILTAVVELDRRWHALDMSGDAARSVRFGAARQTIQERFDREQEAQRTQLQFERRLRAWIAALAPAAEPDAYAALRAELAALREEAQRHCDATALAQLDAAGERLGLWEADRGALAAADALVAQAEQLAAGAGTDSAELLAHWQALDKAVRAPALTRRFEAALLAIEQRRLARVEYAKQEAIARRHQLHGALYAAEQALAAGQLQAARAAADQARRIRALAGDLPKPTTQRIGRLLQQLTELERWESFGQNDARIRLCERAEALAARAMTAPKLALEVQALRSEWKALDQQHAGVPKALWTRFDSACEKAYAPAARYFAEAAARNKEARSRREEFIAASAAQAAALLAEPRDGREIERWLHDTERNWREGDLGSVVPAAWKKLDARFREAVAPLHTSLSAQYEQAKAARRALIDAVTALGPRAMERDAPSQVKAIQARWQEQARALPLGRRDERILWEKFRAACDAVFNARQARRKEEDAHNQDLRRALEELCAQIERLAAASEQDEQDVRRLLRGLREQWSTQCAGGGPALRHLEARYKKAGAAVEAVLSARARSRESAVWETLAAKERLCGELDVLVHTGGAADESLLAAAQEKWLALPALPPAWEQKMEQRRDGARRALSEPAAAGEYVARIGRSSGARRERLVELELLLGLDSPPEFQQHRLALQVKQLKERFRGGAAAPGQAPGEILLAWSAQPGTADALDLQRFERIVSMLARTRAGN